MISSLKINVYDQQNVLELTKQSVESVVVSFLEWGSIHIDEVSIHFITDEAISDLHKKYFNDPSPTDCISFPIDSPGQGGYCHLGEIFISTETAQKYASDHQLNPLDEALLYLIHGLLHLLGFDDISEKDQKIMRKKEKSCISYIKKQGISF